MLLRAASGATNVFNINGKESKEVSKTFQKLYLVHSKFSFNSNVGLTL